MIRRLQPKLADVTGITLFMQPVQDLTVEDRVSRTEFQYTLEDPKADDSASTRRGCSTKLQALPQLTDVASDQEDQGLTGQRLRPGHGLAAGDHAVHHRSDVLRRLWTAPSLGDVHAVEPISRGTGADAEISAETAGAERSVHPDRRDRERGQRRRRTGGRRHFVHGDLEGPMIPPGTRGTSIVTGAGSTAASNVFNGVSASSAVFTNSQAGSPAHVLARGSVSGVL